MRPLNRIASFSILIIAAFPLVGCVCVDGGGGCCGPAACARSAGPTPCGDCSPCGLGPSPIAQLFGLRADAPGCENCSSCAGGCGGGCGELYVDEWVSEPPTVDNCGCGECLTCGRQPVRSLLRLILGDSCSDGCDECCDSSLSLGTPLVQDGFSAGAWSANRGCNCGSGHMVSTEDHSFTESSPAVEHSVTPAPVPAIEGSPTATGPTPAPPIPKSAMRLNPASRKVMR